MTVLFALRLRSRDTVSEPSGLSINWCCDLSRGRSQGLKDESCMISLLCETWRGWSPRSWEKNAGYQSWGGKSGRRVGNGIESPSYSWVGFSIVVFFWGVQRQYLAVFYRTDKQAPFNHFYHKEATCGEVMDKLIPLFEWQAHSSIWVAHVCVQWLYTCVKQQQRK